MIRPKKIKHSSHPVMFFIYLSLLVIIASGILNALNYQATYDKLTTISGEVEAITVSVNSLLSLDGLKFLLTSVYDNLVSFAPFGTLIIGAISFGIALKSGFLKALFTKLSGKLPKFLIVFIYSLLCILASVDSSLGYVLLLPLGAVLFMSMGRNPIGGIVIGFVSIASGHGAGFFVNSLDYNLSSYTEASARLTADYDIALNSNLIFIIVAALLIATVFTIISEKIITRKLGKNAFEDDELMLEEVKENKGLIAALIATVVYLIPIVLMIIPSSKENFIGLLLDKSQTEYSKMLFSADSLLMTNLVGLVSFMFAIQGFVYGVAAGTIRKIRDVVNYSIDYLRSIGGIFVLIFFAAQLSALFKESNIGVVTSGFIANLISSSNFSFIPLILILLLLTMLLNILVPASVPKWSIIAPTIMPTIIKSNVAPEFAQLVFRAGDSITNCITPLFVYFVIFIGFVEVYTKNKNDFSIRRCYKLLFPYFLSVLAIWTVMIISWYIAGFPIGPGVYPSI